MFAPKEALKLGEPLLVIPKVYLSKPHHFKAVYQQIRKSEGNYVNLRADRGRETYAGISRKNFPDWPGWYFIDQCKPLQRHDSIPQVEWLVRDWYLSKWIDAGFEKVEDYDVALNLFDFAIHSSPRTVERKVNRVLSKFGCDPVEVSGDWVPESINTLPPREFVLMLKIERLKLFNYLVTHYPDQRVFYRGWLQRLSDI